MLNFFWHWYNWNIHIVFNIMLIFNYPKIFALAIFRCGVTLYLAFSVHPSVQLSTLLSQILELTPFMKMFVCETLRVMIWLGDYNKRESLLPWLHAVCSSHLYPPETWGNVFQTKCNANLTWGSRWAPPKDEAEGGQFLAVGQTAHYWKISQEWTPEFFHMDDHVENLFPVYILPQNTKQRLMIIWVADKTKTTDDYMGGR